MKIVAGILLGAISTCQAMGFDRAKALFSHLSNKSGYHVELKLDEENYINAWVDSPYRVTITQGLLNSSTDAEILLVMGHELGHIDRQHYRSKHGSYKQEMDADVTGYYYCRQLKYSKSKCISFMYKMKKQFGNGTEDGVHPDWNTRIKNVLGE